MAFFDPTKPMTFSPAQVAVLKQFVEFNDAAIPESPQLNNFLCEGAYFDYVHAVREIAPELTMAEWQALCALFSPDI